MFTAVKTPAKKWAPIIDRASGGPEIGAVPVGICGKHVDPFSCRVVQHVMLIRLHIISLFRMQKEPLATFATFGAGIAGHPGLYVRQQSPC